MSEDEIAGPFARKTPRPDQSLPDDLLDSLAESNLNPTPTPIHPPTPADPAYENREVIERGGLFGRTTMELKETDSPESLEYLLGKEGFQAHVDKLTKESEAAQTTKPALPLRTTFPAYARPTDPNVQINPHIENDITAFYQLSDYQPPRRGVHRYSAAAAVLFAGALVGTIFGATYHSAEATDVAPVTTRTRVTPGTEITENGPETATEQRTARCSICSQENCSRSDTHERHTEPGTETKVPASTDSGVRTTHSQSLASFIGNYQFRTNWNGRSVTYTLDGTTTEKAQAYNLLTRIAYEDRVANPQGKMTYLESNIFERCDPDGNRHISLSDVQRVASQYATIRQN